MGQHFSTLQASLAALTETNRPSDEQNLNEEEDLNFLLPNPNKTGIIDSLQKSLWRLTNAEQFSQIRSEMEKILNEQVRLPMMADNDIAIGEIEDMLGKPEQLRTAFLKKLAAKKPKQIGFTNPSSTNSSISNRSVLDILSKFSIGMTSLKEVLPVLNKLMFDTQHTYDLHNVLKQFHVHYESIRPQWKQIMASSTENHGELSL